MCTPALLVLGLQDRGWRRGAVGVLSSTVERWGGAHLDAHQSSPELI